MKKCLCCGRRTAKGNDYCKIHLEQFNKLKKEMNNDKKNK